VVRPDCRAVGAEPADENAERKLVVVGQGYVGLPMALRASRCGYFVVGFDTDESRVQVLASGRSFAEEVPDVELRDAIDGGNYRPSANPAECAEFDVAVITVPTPLTDGAPDLSYVRQAATTLGMHLRPGSLVVLESTTYPGTTEEVVGPLLEKGSGLVAGVDFHLGYSPERIDPGNAAHPFWDIPKVVSGINSISLKEVDEFYSRIVATTVPVSDPRVAELTKLLENTFRHVNIALVNELAMFAWDLGIDIWEVIDAASTKPFGFMRFNPGPGVGGHCLPIDPSYLSWQVMRSLGQNFRFVELANDINSHMPDYVVRRIAASLNGRRKALSGSRVLLLGLSYKANTGDDREAPARGVSRRLLDAGAEVRAVDPHVTREHLHPGVQRVDLTREEVRLADLVVILTDHDDFDYELVLAEAVAIFDTRCRIRGPRVEYL